MENFDAFIVKYKKTLNSNELKRFNDANFQDWFLKSIYNLSKEPKLKNFTILVNNTLDQIYGSKTNG